MMDPTDEGLPTHGAASLRIVCGSCAEILPGDLPSPAAADEAADEHALEDHPERRSVVILPASIELAREQPDEVVEIAVAAQERLEGSDEPLTN